MDFAPCDGSPTVAPSPNTVAMVKGIGDDSLCSAALCNTRTQPHQEMDAALSRVITDLAQSVCG
jgi:hypothetical protein